MSVRRFDTSSQMLYDELDPYKNITYITVGYFDIVSSSIAGVPKFLTKAKNLGWGPQVKHNVFIGTWNWNTTYVEMHTEICI